MKTFAKIFLWLIVAVAVLAGGLYAAHQVTPWPAAMLIRYAFESGAAQTSRALEKHVPKNVGAILNERYDDADSDALLDVYFPEDGTGRMGTVVWIHGGGFLAGSKTEVANYAKILAAKGFTVVSVGYSLAPSKTYPTPVRQANAALVYLAKNAQRLQLNAYKFVLSGDSAGAHIAAQLANAISVPDYAKALGIVPAIDRLRLAGAILYCGPYDLASVGTTGLGGMLGATMRWSYTGVKDPTADPRFETFSVAKHVTAEFPPAFISAGNADPLLPQSVALADSLEKAGVRVERLFFAPDHKPPLPHEYQFNLDTEAGRTALERSVQFLTEVTK